MVPGMTRPGATSHIPVGALDIFPTLAELIHEKPPAYCDGESLVPILKNGVSTRKPVLSAYELKDSTNGKPYDGYTIRTQRYRYIYYPPSGLEELYDHEIDQHEWDNIAYRPVNRDLVARLRAQLREQVPHLTWSEKWPQGYEVLEDGTIRKTDYVPLENLKQKKWGL
jgi:arylsulfatase A-like enzyme